MCCIICLVASADAGQVCSCSARVCPPCLLALLDHGRDRCVQCGSCFEPLSVVKACLLSVRLCVTDGSDLARPYLKLAVAYSRAGRPRRARHSLEIAQNHAVPGSRLFHFIQLENAQNALILGHPAEAERYLKGVMPTLLQLPTTLAEALLYTLCCTMLSKTDVQFERYDSARLWLRRAIGIQADLDLHGELTTSLQLDANILRIEGKHHEAKRALQIAEDIMTRHETDEVLRCKLQLDIASTEVELGEHALARERISGFLPTLRRRKSDRCSAKLVPVAARALSTIVSPRRRLRRKTFPERVEFRVTS